jgi:DNA-binding MarR family transcriptional regulator
MGKMGERLMVHPAAVTNAISRLEQRGLVQRQMSPDDRRVVLATITPAGRAVADEATAALNQAAFGLPELTQDQAAQATAILHLIRAAAGDV